METLTLFRLQRPLADGADDDAGDTTPRYPTASNVGIAANSAVMFRPAQSRS